MFVRKAYIVVLLIYLFTGHSHLLASPVETDHQADQQNKEETEESPWLLAPTFSSDPKVGTSLGFLAGYLFKLDSQSTSSMAGVMSSYSDTNSVIGGAFLRSYWDADSRRLNMAIAGGKIKNDYDDFLGTGLPVSSTDNLKLFYIQYLQEVRPAWFVGVQGVYTNYLIVGDNFASQELLKLFGLTGFDSGAIGLMLMFDSRNNQNTPTSGTQFSIDNFAYREAFGGEENFDTLKLQFKQYLSHGDGHVFAYRLNGRWTSDAPPSGYSSVQLRGYVRGEYLAPHSLLFEAEQRWHLKGRFGVNIFAGVVCLYGGNRSCDDSNNLYPSAGIGVQYLLKQSEQMVITMDYAEGEGDNNGFYIRFGQAF
jgi:hypothetical protein